MPDNRAGSSILHYRILRPIGSGGMGVVYEAEDTKLGRRVALKFLPPDLACDRAALERFTREARAASALNHPNICTIYAIEEAGEATFIAMELLEGESLDRVAAKRPLAWDALVDTGVQIADALDAAHHRGIIHRDIKPANIFLTTDGRAKVLDFGVAKFAMERLAEGETMGEDTRVEALTGAGVAVGTVAYMSPEQARGDVLDGRSDVFGLAAVLYEMSTGRPAFEGRTSAVIFSKILESEPEAPREINPTLPPKLEDVILRGLEKDRDLRYQSAADLRADLKRVKRDGSSGRLAFVPPMPGGGAASPVSSGAVIATEVRRHKGLAAAAAVIIVGLIGAAGYGVYAWARAGDRAQAVAAPATTMTLTRLTTSGDVDGCVSISPDGKYVVYCDSSGKLKLHQVATGATVVLGDQAGHTAFSPDSNFVYVTVTNDTHPNGVLWVIPSLGGESHRVVSDIGGAAAVSPDGQRIAFVRHSAAGREALLLIASARGGNERRVATGSLDETWFEGTGVSWSPDGTRLSVTQATVIGGYRMRPAIVHIDSGQIETPGTKTWAELGRTVWLPGSGGILFTASETLETVLQFWTMSYPDGAATRITSDARGFGTHSVSVTADGSAVATVATDTVANIWSTNAEATAPLVQWTSGLRFDGDSGMVQAANGRLYYASFDREVGVWSLDAPGGRPRRLTQSYAEIPSTPNDGSFVAFQAIHEDRFRIWRMDADGSNPRVLSRGEDDIVPMVSPDGRWIYYWAAGAKGGIMRMAADGSNSSVLAELSVRPVSVSPDGRQLLMSSVDASVPSSHVILDAATGAIRTRVDLPLDARADWGRSDGVIAYALKSNLWEQPAAGGARRQITNFTSGMLFNFSYSHDRKRLFLSRGQQTGDVVLLRNFR